LPGGGALPPSIGVAKQDPWGGTYGYCAWDHGSDVNTGACAGQNRRAGAPDQTKAVLAIISSGPDGVFQTSCNDYDVAAPDAPLVDKISGSDDLVLAYAYGEAVAQSGGLWNLC